MSKPEYNLALMDQITKGAKLSARSLITSHFKLPCDVAMAVLLFAALFTIYFPALNGGLIIDDSYHVTRPALRNIHGLWRIWFQPGATPQYYPLLYSAFWLEYCLWGGSVFGYHTVNVLLHFANAVFVVAIVRQLGLKGEWLAGFIFALHPVSVESVAWISEQKNSLSTLFYLASAFLYLRFDGERRWLFYCLALCLFVLALLSKTATATLPIALLIIFWWKRERIECQKDLLPLIPWLGIGAASGCLTSWVERTFNGADSPLLALSPLQHCLLAAQLIWFYLGKLFWPSDLTHIYPIWKINPYSSPEYLFPVTLMTLLAVLLIIARIQRGPLAGFLFFVITLLPVLGFIGIAGFAYSYASDHLQYVACLGIIVPVAAGFTKALDYLPSVERVRWLPYLFAATLLLPLCIVSYQRSITYRTPEIFYRDIIAHDSNISFAHGNLAAVLMQASDSHEEALRELRIAFALDPDSFRNCYNLGLALESVPGKQEEAISMYRRAIKIDPTNSAVHENLGTLFADIPGHNQNAIDEYKEAIRLEPQNADAHNNLGAVLLKNFGNKAAAFKEFEDAIRYQPNLADAHNNLGTILLDIPGRRSDAITEFQDAIDLKPEYASAYNNLGTALAQRPDQTSRAITEFQAAIHFDPNSAQAHYNLANALVTIPTEIQEAFNEYEIAIRIDPNYFKAYNDYGFALMAYMPTRLSQAIDCFQKAISLNPSYAVAENNLGVAFSKSPDHLAEAVSHFRAAIQIDPNFAEAHYDLAMTLLKVQGMEPEATVQLEKALQINPAFEQARQALRDLDARRRPTPRSLPEPKS